MGGGPLRSFLLEEGKRPFPSDDGRPLPSRTWGTPGCPLPEAPPAYGTAAGAVLVLMMQTKYSPRQGAQESYDHRMKAKEKNKNKNRN